MPPPLNHRRGRNSGSNSTSTSRRNRSVKSIKNFKYKLRENLGALSCKSGLTSAFLNVDGLTESKLEDVSSFVSAKSPDIFFLLETKRRLEDIGSDISIPGYELTELRRSDTSGDRPGGGIAFYTKNTGGLLFERHTPDIIHGDLEYVNNERFWVTINSLQCKTAICGVYAACQYGDDRHGEWNDGLYWVLRQEAFSLRSSGYRVQFLGDFNGHIGNVLGKGIVGNNGDINKNGERFLSFLADCDLRHINGELRMQGDTNSRFCTGLWTRQRGNSRSIIDYAAISAEHVDTVLSMNVDDTGSQGGGSDHNWLWIKVADKFRHLVRVQKTAGKKDVWNIKDNHDWTEFKAEVVRNLQSGDLSDLGVDELASAFTSALRSAGLVTIGYKNRHTRTSMRSKTLPRHVVDGIAMKRDLEKIWKSLSSSTQLDPAAVTAAEEAFNAQVKVVNDMFMNLRVSRHSNNPRSRYSASSKSRKQFWTDLTGKVKQTSSIASVLSSAGALKCSDDEIRVEVEKHLCSVFQGSLESIVHPQVPSPPTSDHLYSSSNSPSRDLPDHNYNFEPTPTLPRLGSSADLHKHPSNWLGKDFTLTEVKKIASRLSNGKSSGWDNIPSEFLKNAPDAALVVLTLLFNKIKNSGIFPKGWNCGRITLIHKKGLRAKLGNYRPITVLISLSGFYSKLLNERLICVVETHKLLGEIQNGFRKDRCGSDNLFILNTVLWKARALAKKVHLGFVDISKAYDSVNREILWSKLEAIGIDGVFLESLKSIYSDDSVRCTVNDTTTRSVYLRRGLRQGCSLSPMLFALYILEIGQDLLAAGEGFSLGNICISGLLFADDIVLVSSSAAGLLNLFRIVKSRCDKLLLEINTGEGKSEVISPDDTPWELFGEDGEPELTLRRVLQYKYLGLETTSSIVRTCLGKQQKCVKIAKKYKFACIHLGKRGSNVVDATLATWENIALPSILFGCESVPFSESNILAIERLQSQIAKNVLGLPSNTTNLCAQTDLGIVPFRLALYKAQLSFYFRVLDLPDSRWVKQALLEHLGMEWPSPYLKYISAIRDTVRLPFVPPTTRYLASHLFQWSLSEVNSTLSRLELPYVSPLTSFKRQPYVSDHRYLDTIAQFRLSNAGLGNRYPRFAGVPYLRQTNCPLCNSILLTEAHVIFFCPYVEHFRGELDLIIFRTICLTKGFSESDTFSLFINGLDWNKKPVDLEEIIARGLALDTLRGHWLARW